MLQVIIMTAQIRFYLKQHKRFLSKPASFALEEVVPILIQGKVPYETFQVHKKEIDPEDKVKVQINTRVFEKKSYRSPC